MALVNHNANFLKKIWQLNKNMINFQSYAQVESLQEDQIHPSIMYFIPIQLKFYHIGNNFHEEKTSQKHKKLMEWIIQDY